MCVPAALRDIGIHCRLPGDVRVRVRLCPGLLLLAAAVPHLGRVVGGEVHVDGVTAMVHNVDGSAAGDAFCNCVKHLA